MGAGYDISLSASDSKSGTISAPFSITGGGGSPLTTAINQAGSKNPTASAPAQSKWQTYALYALAGVAAIAALWFFVLRKR